MAAARWCLFSQRGLNKGLEIDSLKEKIGDSLSPSSHAMTISLHYHFFLVAPRLFKEQNGTTGPLRQILVSKVIGATLGNGSINLNGGKVEILLSTLNLDLYDVDRSSAKCAYWDVSKQDWSFDGCELVPTNGSINLILKPIMLLSQFWLDRFLYIDKSTTRCRCDHLTNFAVIMDINGLFQNKVRNGGSASVHPAIVHLSFRF